MCSYKSLLTLPCSRYSQMESRTRQECAATSPYCLSPVVSTKRQREEQDRNVQLQVLIASALQSVIRNREKNQIGICTATSPYCLSPAVSTHRWREELDRNVQLQVLIASVLQSVLSRRREELDRNVQLQVLIDSVLQSVLTDGEKNQIGMCSYKSLLPQPCSQYSQKQREELDRNIQLQVLIASALQSVLTDREKNQIGMCSYKSLLPPSCILIAAISLYCLSPAVSTHRWRIEQSTTSSIALFLQSVLRDREKNSI